nr:MAG TPA: hypothetical protein [Caudoviricetes sp.]DAW73128.1 MAG TPA: hypothetical protein [Caudoviricetes sp.]
MFIFAVSKLLFAVRMPPTPVGCFRIYAIVNVFRLRRVGCAETPRRFCEKNLDNT